MKSKDIREAFLKYFEQNGHTRVRSSALIPAEDPTLLFTNAGMVQFKDCFLGVKDPGYRRATTAQKCVRAGGKHNDLENVGFTPRHHTFFEMMGNFSFGDYFKKEAIAFAWEFLTRHLKLPQERLWVTVFETDDEAAELWLAQGVPAERIHRLGEKDNFWAMGDTGPCGPCTEIHWDWGDKYGPLKSDGTPDWENGRFLEIWNLVFMQFNRDSSGKMEPLPKPSVDTGAGLERLAAVMQGVFSNYDTDLFQPILQAVAKRTGIAYGKGGDTDVSQRVIADHLRSGAFLLTDGVIPSNEGRGYVLRRILRRAIRHGKKLGQEKPFIHELVPTLVAVMGEAYPELAENQKRVQEMLREEEERFHETLHRGMGILEEAIGKVRASGGKTLPGDIAFKLYDTYGFPLDLTEVISQESSLTVDQAGFEACMERQRSQSVWSGGQASQAMENLAKALQGRSWQTEFDRSRLASRAKLVGLFDENGQPTDRLKTGDTGFTCFDHAPFYAESGGQVGDSGWIREGDTERAEVITTFKNSNRIVQRVRMTAGDLREGQSYDLRVNETARHRTAINHTATHMLHAALREVLGDRVKQAGSLVEPNRLRFDFTYPKALTDEQKQAIEERVNQAIREAHETVCEEMSYDEAIAAGALAFFDEKYGDRVRVMRIGPKERPFSVELCGGTHLENGTAEIGFFKILGESSVASGVRRIEAITAERSLEYLTQRNRLLESLERKLGVREEAVLKKVEAALSEIRELQRQNEDLKLKLARGAGGSGGTALWDKKQEIKGVQVVMDEVSEGNPKILRTLVDQVRDKLKERTMVLLATRENGKATLCLGLTKDLTDRFSAKEIIQPLAAKVGGSGGGRPDFAQAGGTQPENLNDAFNELRAWLESNA